MNLSREGIEQVLSEYRDRITGTRLREEDIDEHMQSVSRTLFDYCTLFPEDTEFAYSIVVRFMRIVLKVEIRGEKRSPDACGGAAEEQAIEREIRSMRLASSWETRYLYFRGKNILLFVTPPARAGQKAKLLNPVLIAVLIGLAAGLVCSVLPEGINGFLVDDIATPVLDIAIKLMSGVMGPIMFISLVTAISTLDNINEFNRLGSKFFRRFLLIAVFLTGLIMLVALIVFTFSQGNMDAQFSSHLIIDLLLSVVPVSLVTPFVENDFPQLMVLGIVMGVALLLLNKKESVLNSFLMDLRDWMNELLRIVLKTTPLVPGLTIFRVFARRDFSAFLQGWKYIAAAYGCMILVLLVKLVKVWIRVKGFRLSFLLRKWWPMVRLALLSGSEIAAIKKFYETAEEDLSITRSFTQLWFPMNQAMLSPVAPIYFVLGPCFITEITRTPVSIAFLFILYILTVQLSMAYPGGIAGLTILFNALMLPAEHVGLFSAYGVFTKNAAAAYGMLFRALEHTEIAYVTGNLHADPGTA